LKGTHVNARWLSLPILLLAALPLRADGPADNRPEAVRPVPPPGITVPAADAKRLRDELAELGREIDRLKSSLKSQPRLLTLLPDVQIYYQAVRYALDYQEFFDAREIPIAYHLLARGRERASALHAGQAPWNTATGLVVRGYVSRIDGSVQPYGLVVPKAFHEGTSRHFRLDGWFHGRGEKLSEINFIADREKSPGPITPKDAFFLHPYGRYCNANKFAGEIDFLEALDSVRRHYPIDDDRIAVRGFSMGGAACWQFAVHYPGRWAAAAPGAGFSETADFLRVFQKETLNPTWYEKKLWHLYDCTDYALNLANLPTVAYSGEIDTQKQAADKMAEAMQAQGLTLVHLIGPKTAHSYHPRTKEEIDRRIDRIMGRGRELIPARIHFTTWTLRYNQLLWVTLDGLDHHWDRARVDAEITDQHTITVQTSNVSGLTLSMPSGYCPLDPLQARVILDGRQLPLSVPSDRSLAAHFRKSGSPESWAPVASTDDGVLRKRHGLQGPIDDAFMERFLMVRPTGQGQNPNVGSWVTAEMAHATEHWRKQFRGDAPIKNDDAITDADIASSNLVLWGDPQSNKVLAKIAARLPITWTADQIAVGAEKFPANHHVPVLVFPNPLNPKRYVVLNSCFTFREYDYLNNARQVPKLPDYAIIDIDVPASSRAAGGIATAGFFGEEWQLVAHP
jgi:pimeloyl-ACP methyl ester carboxylesterase